ncbi:MAG: cell division protein FtsA [Patescibacteria group bacterium]
MRRQYVITGIDMGSQTIRVAVMGWSRGMEVPRLLSLVKRPAAGIKRGAVVDPDIAAQELRKALHEVKKTIGIRLDHAYLAQGEARMNMHVARGTVAVARPDGEITAEDVRRVIASSEDALPRFSNREILHTFPRFFHVDRDLFVHDPVSMNGMKLEVETLFVSTFAPHVRGLVRVAEAAGIMPDNVIASVLASAQVLLSKKHREIGCLLLDIGADVTNVSVWEEGKLYSFEVIPLGSGHITQDIALAFQIDVDTAEKVKRAHASLMEDGSTPYEIRLAEFRTRHQSANGGSKHQEEHADEVISHRKLQEIVAARLSDIFELADKHLKKVGRSELLPGGVVLAGGGARIGGLLALARRELRLPVEFCEAQTDLFEDPQRLFADPLYHISIGAALWGIAEEQKHRRSFFGQFIPRRLARLAQAFIP